MVSNPLAVLPVAALGVTLVLAPALAQTKPAAADAAEAPSAPTEASLTVGALQIASVPNLEVAGFDIAVATNGVTYSYYFRNAATADLAVTATVSLPELQASADGSETWTLPAADPDNFIGLTIAVAGAQLPTKAEIHAYALGVDRLAELKADHLPVIPFGADVDKALGALSPEAAAGLPRLALFRHVIRRSPSYRQGRTGRSASCGAGARACRRARPRRSSLNSFRLMRITEWRRATSRTLTT